MRPQSHTARWIEARYRGTCTCGASFPRGAVIRYDGALRAKGLHGSLCVTGCPTCKPTDARQGPSDRDPDPVDLAYEDDCARGAGLDSMNPADRD